MLETQQKMSNGVKKTFIAGVFALVALLALGNGAVFAHDQQIALPSAGLTPESPFYFLDRLGEALRTFFTFNPESKARLQITFAAERVAEIKIILETKGVEAKGLEVAQSRLQEHLANAATIVTDQKAKGKDVSQLAKELDDEFDGPKSALKETFKAEKRALETQEKELKREILEARQAGDAAQVESLVQQLGQVKAQKDLLELKEEEQEETLEKEQERLKGEMEAKEEAEKAIREAEKEKQEVLEEAAEEDVAVPTEAFAKFDRLLLQAKELFERGNYQGAKQLAKQAEKSIETVKKDVGDLEEAKGKEEELKEEEQGEKEREENVITYTDAGYSPATLQIKKGETVTFKNQSGQSMWTASAAHPTHTVYPTTGGCIGSTFDACQAVQPGDSWSFRFDVSGAWKYHNHLSPGDAGTIVVK